MTLSPQPAEPLSTGPGERAVERLLRDARLALPEELSEIVCDAVREFGGRNTTLRIVDHAQQQLVALDASTPVITIDGTLAGRVYRQAKPYVAEGSAGQRVYAPILDGLERLGTLSATFALFDSRSLPRMQQIASIVADLLVSKRLTTDGLQRSARRRPMSLAAEMQWSLMPPLTAGTADVSIAAMLEPAYEVGGDIVDYALSPNGAEFAVFDAMGHGVQASLLASLVVGAYRNCRRHGEALTAIATAVETAVADQFPDHVFVTGIIARLDCQTGRLAWINAGHPAPLLIRDGHVVKELHAPRAVPLGVGSGRSFAVGEEMLQPEDRVLVYTDGVIEARTPNGEPFGVSGLADFITRAILDGEPTPETMRRLSHALVDHQHGQLRDDATQMLVEWQTGTSTRIARTAQSAEAFVE